MCMCVEDVSNSETTQELNQEVKMYQKYNKRILICQPVCPSMSLVVCVPTLLSFPLTLCFTLSRHEGGGYGKVHITGCGNSDFVYFYSGLNRLSILCYGFIPTASS